MTRNPRFRSVAERDRDQWALWLGLFAAMLVLTLTLTSCTGTRLVMSGTVCNQQFAVQLQDHKDRSGFDAQIACSDGSSIAITSSESSTSQVVQAQAELATRLTALAEILARSLPMPPVAYRKEVMRHSSEPVTDHDTETAGAGMRVGDPPILSTRGEALEQLAYTIEAEGRTVNDSILAEIYKLGVKPTAETDKLLRRFLNGEQPADLLFEIMGKTPPTTVTAEDMIRDLKRKLGEGT